AKAVRDLEDARKQGFTADEVARVIDVVRTIPGYEDIEAKDVEIGSTIYANKPGDGSAREQAASCQRVLGALANITREYATKRYRSNCMNWGMLPFQYAGNLDAFEIGDWIFVPGIRAALDGDLAHIDAYVIKDGAAKKIELYIADMTEHERAIVKAGCLINYNRARNKR
ncbi:MAG: hydratase, partial [Coriobacteriales bacterium]